MDANEIVKHFPDVKIVRDGEFRNLGLLMHHQIPDMLTYLKDIKYIDQVYGNDHIAVILTYPEAVDDLLKNTDCAILVSEYPEKVFFLFHNYLSKETDFYPSYGFLSKVDSSAVIREGAYVSPNGVTIGRGTIIETGAVVMEGSTIGDNCYIGQNTVIGTRGFQYYREYEQAIYVDHIAGIIIEDNVEILANSCVASGLFVPTYIEKETKIDNLVHVAHSVHIGKRAIIPAGAIIGGSATIGDRAWVGINSTIRQIVTVGNEATVCMGAVVTKDVNDGESVSGNFAVEHYKNVVETKRIAGKALK